MKRFDTQRRRLTWVLGGVFAALFLASVLLILQSFERLRFEAMHGQRLLAEELVARVNATLNSALAPEEGRPPTDYDFLVVSGEHYVQRSPLSSLTPETTVPGVVGYFQVDAAGQFSTPLLPAHVDNLDALSLTESEYRERRGFQERLRRLLERDEAGDREDAQPAAPTYAAPDVDVARQAGRGSLDPGDGARPAAGHAIFQKLNSARNASRAAVAASLADATELARPLEEELHNEAPAVAAEVPAEPALTRRRQEVRQVTVSAAHDAPLRPRISAFQSSVDPFSLTLLDEAHLVAYRRVWLEGQHIQGMVIDLSAFLDELVGSPFLGASLARYGDLAVAIDGNVLRRYSTQGYAATSVAPADLGGRLLLRTRLAAPADPVELLFSVGALPLGPGASALAWASGIMAVVLCAGFYLLRRLGRHHIRLAEQQHDFVSAVSHELKTPLTSIRMYGEILKAGWADEGRKQTYYAFILSESERLSRLIGNVLQLARISRNDALAPDLQVVAAGVLLDRVETKVASALSAAGLSLHRVREGDAGACRVRVDEDAFTQVVINLVENAIKFSVHAARPVVELGCRMDGRWLEFRVRDYGPGVAAKQMRRIFELFYRAETELTRETVGTGIGLALVRELVDRMGGQVDVVNRRPGAEFRVRLPALPCAGGG